MATYYISDGYFKKEYPEHTGFDMAKFYAMLMIEQKTTLEGIIGEELNSFLADNINSIPPYATDFFEQVQYLLVFLVARQFTALNTKSADTDTRKDVVWQALTGKISYLKGKIKRTIENSTELDAIYSGDTTTTNERGDFPLYFPK